MQKAKKNKKPASHRLYERYAYLADIYANKLFNTNAIGMDREDVVQELRLKIITSIRAYGKRWADFKKTGLYKPVPIKYYIQTAMNNKLIDMVEEIKKDVNQYSLSMEDHSFDYGIDSSGFSVLQLTGTQKEAVVCGVDLLQGLDGQAKDAFCMYLKGHPLKTIEKVFKGKVQDIGLMIRAQVETLREHKDEMYSGMQKTYYSYQMAEED
jgi:DNA-directed RNA polymerase specialized sigma24 family protein